MAPNNPPNPIKTPCVGICSTTYGDDVCRGCFRSAQEVVSWNAYQDPQKLQILSRLNALITELMAQKIEILDAQRLKAQCQHYHLRIREEFTPYTWAHALLRENLISAQDLSSCGLQIKAEFSELSPAQLIEGIDEELLAQSLALKAMS